MLIHGVTYSRVVSVIEDVAIDRLNTLCRGSTLDPHHGIHGLALPFGWTNGIPTKPSIAMTLFQPLRPTPHWAKSWVAPCLPKTPTATVVAKHKRSQTGTRYHNKNNRHTRLISAYLIRVARAHNLPSLEAPASCTTIDRIKAFP